MKTLSALCPKAPDWQVDWDRIDLSFVWIQQLRGCQQDKIYHGEGDVWIHTRMVIEALASLDSWRRLPESERFILLQLRSCTMSRSPRAPGWTKGELRAAAILNVEPSTPARYCGRCMHPLLSEKRFVHLLNTTRRPSISSITMMRSGAHSE